MTYLLDLSDGRPPIRCRDAHQALLLARLWVAYATGQPAVQVDGQP
jgi:hypothetical protein